VDYGADHALMTRSASVRSYVRVRALRRTFFIFPSQVFKGHMHLRPFDQPGQADLTANVNLCT
jgi:SAM-dependent MidA family methyltransferase